MKINELLTVIALVVNTIALILVIVQTNATKKGVEYSKLSFEKDIKIRSVSMLPKANYIIHVVIKLEEWMKTLRELENELKIAIQEANMENFHVISEKYHTLPQNLVSRIYYEDSPDWLSEIYMSSAKHYYNVMSTASGLNRRTHDDTRMSIANDVMDRIIESKTHIMILKSFVDTAIPESYLSTPDSMRDDSFLYD